MNNDAPSLQEQIINLRAYVGALDILVEEIFRVLEKRDQVFREYAAALKTFEDVSLSEPFSEYELSANRAMFSVLQKKLQVALSRPAAE